jgi:hypothetical protein
MTSTAHRLPAWVTWQVRVPRRQPAPAGRTRTGPGRQRLRRPRPGDARVDPRPRRGQVSLVVNTHCHSDHVGGNALLQAAGAGIAASAPDSQAIARRDPGRCGADYLDQPVSRYTVDEPLEDAQVLRLGEADWEVVCHARAHARPPMPVAARGTAACRRRCALGLRRRMGECRA